MPCCNKIVYSSMQCLFSYSHVSVHCAALHCTVLCCAVLHCTVLCCAVLHCTVLCCAVLHCTMLCCTALYCTMLCCTALYCTMLCCAAHNFQKRRIARLQIDSHILQCSPSQLCATAQLSDKQTTLLVGMQSIFPTYSTNSCSSRHRYTGTLC